MYVLVSNIGEPIIGGKSLPEPHCKIGVLSATGREVKIPVYKESPAEFLNGFMDKVKVLSWNDFVHSPEFNNSSVIENLACN